MKIMFGYWKTKVSRLQSQISDAQQQIETARAYAEALFKHGKDYAGKYNSFFNLYLQIQPTAPNHFLLINKEC